MTGKKTQLLSQGRLIKEGISDLIESREADTPVNESRSQYPSSETYDRHVGDTFHDVHAAQIPVSEQTPRETSSFLLEPESVAMPDGYLASHSMRIFDPLEEEG